MEVIANSLPVQHTMVSMCHNLNLTLFNEMTLLLLHIEHALQIVVRTQGFKFSNCTFSSLM